MECYVPGRADQLRSSLQQPDRGITLLEAAGSLHEGLLYGLSLVQLARDLDAPVVLVHLWEDSRSVDALWLHSSNWVASAWCGAECGDTG